MAITTPLGKIMAPYILRHLLAVAIAIYFPGVPDGILGVGGEAVRTGKVTLQGDNMCDFDGFFGDIWGGSLNGGKTPKMDGENSGKPY